MSGCLPACMYVCPVHAQCAWIPEAGAGSPSSV